MTFIPRITVVSDTTSPHLLQVYAGLYELAAHGKLRIAYRLARTPPFHEPFFNSLWTEVELGEERGIRSLCFDMQDSGDVSSFSLERLQACDLYFKRSFAPAQVAQLPDGLRAKVRPYGLNCFFVGSRDRGLGWRLVLTYLARRKTSAPLRGADIRGELTRLASRAAPGFLQRLLRHRFAARESDLERATGSTGNCVCYQSRLWDPADARGDPEVETLNRSRAATVRLLQQRFKERFLGGLQRTPYAVGRYPHLISPYPGQQRLYLDLLHRSAVSVVSCGLHHSTPWKMVESLAAGLCIVTEPIPFELPVPLQEGVHVLTYHSGEECVAHCERLLADEALAQSMQEANRRYYRENVAPGAIVGNCLKQVCPTLSPEITLPG